MPNDEASATEAEQLYTLEMGREQTRRAAAKRIDVVGKQVERAFKRATGKDPPFDIRMMKTGELMARGSGFLLGMLPWIGVFFRVAARLARSVIRRMRIPRERSFRNAQWHKVKQGKQEIAYLSKEYNIPAPNPATPGGEPKEFFGRSVTTTEYRFLIITGIALTVVGTILIIAFTISTLCQGGLKGLFARFVLRLQTGISMPCP